MNDLISRQAAIDALDKRFDSIPMEQTTEILLLRKDLRNLPSAQSETTRILAEALNGSPLLYPCDKLWSREGWCKDHCKKGQTEPDTECWLKYAETIAAERRRLMNLKIQKRWQDESFNCL